jgi:hypothetical protein
MRQAYERSQEFLQTSKSKDTSEEKLIRTFRKQYLLVSGFNQTEVEGMDLSALSDEELQDMVRKKLLGVQVTNGSKQKVVSVAEANDYLAKGWEYVAKISDNQVIIKLNHGVNV